MSKAPPPRKKVVMPEKKKPAGAPAYMGQYTALMTILLAFFILMLTMGHEKSAGFKEGVGQIKNLIEMTGGRGVLDFWRSMRNPGLPKMTTTKGADPEAMLIGYEQDTLDHFSLDASNIKKIDFLDERQTLRLKSSIRFETGRVRVARNSQLALDQAVATLYSLRNYNVVVCVMVDTGEPEADRLLAAQRAAALVRHIAAQAQIPWDRIRALGQVRTMPGDDGEDPIEVMFMLREPNNVISGA